MTLIAAPDGIGIGGEVLEDEEEVADTGEITVVDDAATARRREPRPPSSDEHHWGQALQYLDRMLEVLPGRKVTVLARRDAGKMHFSLRQGAGEWAGRAPWRIEWGGGASVENPHFQRVHYCELLVRDFLMRCRSGRFPSIEKDMKMVLAHCGSLFLDPGALQEVYHEMVVLERLHRAPEFSPGASVEALTKRPLRLC
jgi:type III protein arginine methyltransferase